MCRRSHGAPFSTFGRIRRADLQITAGAELLTRHASSDAVERSFCARCGSRLFFRHAALPDHEFVAIGSLDDDSDVKVDTFRGSGPYTIRDAPQHEASGRSMRNERAGREWRISSRTGSSSGSSKRQKTV
jgi:hypothetical protein